MNKTLNKILLIIFIFGAFLNPLFAEVLYDDLDSETIENAKNPYVHTDYNYENTEEIPVKLAVKERIKSEKDVYEGQKVDFVVLRHVIYNNKIVVRKGTVVSARVGTIITSGMNGIPASIIFDNFEIPNIKQGQITYSYEIFGQDRSLIVFPLKWALTILPPTGSLTNFIKGGHAKLKPNKTITLYYHPNWT